jgi:hypothetical protein
VKRVFFLVVAVLALAAVAGKAADSTQFRGYISDSMCGAKHMGTGAACVKKCIEGGMKPVFVNEKDKAVWSIDNPGAVKDFYGDHVVVTATADGAAKSVHVESIEAAK